MSPQDEAEPAKDGERNEFRATDGRRNEFRATDDERNEFRPTTGDGSLQRLEAELAALTPRAANVDRDRAMFLAGQASVGSPLARPSSRPWAWPAAFSAMTALAASLLVTMAIRPSVQVVERIVRVGVETASPAASNEANGDPRPADSEQGLPSDVPPAVAVLRPSPSKPAADASYLGLRDRVLAMGIDSWPAQPRPAGDGTNSPPVNYHELLENLLHEG
jgi:hypothetical protein